MNELFGSEVQVKSPRLRWMEKHKLFTHFTADMDEPYSAWSGELTDALSNDQIGTGKTEDDAFADWARKNHVRLWNEE